jgi:hypothetical protein
MGYVIETVDQSGASCFHHETDMRMAASVAEAFLAAGRSVTSIQATDGSDDLPIARIHARISIKRKWREVYGSDLRGVEARGRVRRRRGLRRSAETAKRRRGRAGARA